MAKKKSSSKDDGLKNLSFEEAIRVLTEIVEKIETGQVPLQEGLQQYERGMALIGQCRRILEDAEKRIAEIESQHSPSGASRHKEKETDEDDDKEEELF